MSEPKFTTTSHDEATDALLRLAQGSLRVLDEATVGDRYHDVAESWGSGELFDEELPRLDKLIRGNLKYIAGNTGFKDFTAEVSEKGDSVTVWAKFPGTVVPIRVWRTVSKFFACGNRDFRWQWALTHEDIVESAKRVQEALHASFKEAGLDKEPPVQEEDLKKVDPRANAVSRSLALGLLAVIVGGGCVLAYHQWHRTWLVLVLAPVLLIVGLITATIASSRVERRLDHMLNPLLRCPTCRTSLEVAKEPWRHQFCRQCGFKRYVRV